MWVDSWKIQHWCSTQKHLLPWGLQNIKAVSLIFQKTHVLNMSVIRKMSRMTDFFWCILISFAGKKEATGVLLLNPELHWCFLLFSCKRNQETSEEIYYTWHIPNHQHVQFMIWRIWKSTYILKIPRNEGLSERSTNDIFFQNPDISWSKYKYPHHWQAN